MSKYNSLGTFLGHLRGDYWRPTFHELERLLEFDLPASARKHNAWWANDPSHGHAKSWMGVGWSTGQVSLDKEMVTFHRGNPPPLTEGGAAPAEARRWAGRTAEAARTIARERPFLSITLSAASAFVAGVVIGVLLVERD